MLRVSVGAFCDVFIVLYRVVALWCFIVCNDVHALWGFKSISTSFAVGSGKFGLRVGSGLRD